PSGAVDRTGTSECFTLSLHDALPISPLWLIAVFTAALILGFLAWAAAGSSGTLPMISLLSGALALATPLIFGALGGVIGERAGVERKSTRLNSSHVKISKAVFCVRKE